MPKLQHYYGLNHLHYVTKNTYRRARLYDSECFRNQWVASLGDLRRELGLKIIGYVLMPEHFHRLVWPTAQANPSQVVQKLEDRCVGRTRGAYIPTKNAGTRHPRLTGDS